MLVPLLIGAGVLGLLLLSKKDASGGISSSAAQLPAQQPQQPQQALPLPQQQFQAPPAFVPPAPNVPAAPPVATPTFVQPAAPAATAGQKARVTTNDPPPSGDLIMRTAPNDSAAQVTGGGAEKDGIVTVLNLNASPDGVWSQIQWPGGSRRPGATGFAKKKFLTLLV